MHRPVAGLTMTEIVIVLLVIALLFTVFMPLVLNIRHHARRGSCSNNQRSLVIAMLAYADEYSGRFPSLPVLPSRRDRASATTDTSVDLASIDAVMTTMASFELLAASSDISSKVFACPKEPGRRPKQEALSKDHLATSVLSWPDLDPSNSPSAYAYDWAVPKGQKGVIRAVLADRPQGMNGSRFLTNHNGHVAVTFGDGHGCSMYGQLHLLERNTGHVVWYARDAEFAPLINATGCVNPDAGNDDIFTDDGDGASPDRPNGGSITRSFLK